MAAKKQIPSAAAKAPTALAFEVQVAERAATGSMFKMPGPFTQRGTMVTKATKSAPGATVYLRDEVAAYLAPFAFGGPHHVPGKGVAILKPVGLRLDSCGQIKGQPSTIASRPGAFTGSVQTKAGPVWGFWQPLKDKGEGPRLKLLARAAQASPVTQKLGFAGRAPAVEAARGAAVFGQELGEAAGASGFRPAEPNFPWRDSGEMAALRPPSAPAQPGSSGQRARPSASPPGGFSHFRRARYPRSYGSTMQPNPNRRLPWILRRDEPAGGRVQYARWP